MRTGASHLGGHLVGGSTIRWTLILDSGLWILDSGLWTLDSGFWTLDSGFWILDFLSVFYCLSKSALLTSRVLPRTNVKTVRLKAQLIRKCSSIDSYSITWQGIKLLFSSILRFSGPKPLWAYLQHWIWSQVMPVSVDILTEVRQIRSWNSGI